MDNKTAIALILLIIGFLAADRLFFDGKATAFLAFEFLKLIDTMAIWR